MSAGGLEPDSEWDDSFEAFAAGRLQSPEDLTTDCKTQQNTNSDNPLEHCNNKGALLPITDDAPHHQTCTKSGFEAHKATSQVTNTNTYHFDAFAQFLETIPEHISFESDSITLNTPANSQKLAAHAETNQANSTTNTNYLTDTNVDQAPHHTSSVKLNSTSPDPGSSGLGSSVGEDFLSCLSSYSDKFSASSSEEAEAQNFESDILSFEKSSNSVKNFKPLESEDDITDRSNDLSLDDIDQLTVIQHRDGDEKVDINVLEGSLALQSSVLTLQQPVTAARETPTPKLSELQPKSDVSLQSDKENGETEKGEFSEPLEESSVSVNNATDVMIAVTPDDELCSIHPSLHIITSSPDVRRSSSDSPIERTTLGLQDASRHSPIPFRLFGDFPNISHITNSPSQGFDNTSRVSDQSTTSFLQSLYVSADSQDYQTCESHPSSKCSSGSEPNETLHSANSTLCGDLSDIQTTAGAALGQEVFTNASNEEINQTDQFEAVENSATIPQSFTIRDDFGLGILPAALTDSYVSCNPRKLSEEGVESPHVVSKCPQAQTLHRSQSEGTLTPAFDELLLPSFGSDPGAIQEESSAFQSSVNLPSLTSFDPPLTPDSSSSPVALCSRPFFANGTARSPPSTARASAPKPMPQESQRQQAANQQSR